MRHIVVYCLLGGYVGFLFGAFVMAVVAAARELPGDSTMQATQAPLLPKRQKAAGLARNFEKRATPE